MYYLLGGGNDQQAVYHGQQTSGTGICGDTGRRVYLYPTEYLTYGNEHAALISTSPTGAKTFNLSDHIGSVRTSITGAGSATYDYEPFGAILTGTSPRKGFIDKEQDRETGSGNLGLRAYEPKEGRFWSVDVLAENDPDKSPYHYGENNPVNLKDPNGDCVGCPVYSSAAMEMPMETGSSSSPTPSKPFVGGGGRFGGGGSSGTWDRPQVTKTPTKRQEIDVKKLIATAPMASGGTARSGSAKKGAADVSTSLKPSQGLGDHGAIEQRKLADLKPIHKPGANPLFEQALRRMSDYELMNTVTNPRDKDEMVKAYRNDPRVMNGNTRVIEMQRRMNEGSKVFTPTTRIPVEIIDRQEVRH